MLEWRGNTAQNRRVRKSSRFPDFQDFISEEGFQPAFQQYFTRPMQESELAFLLTVTSECRKSMQRLGYHVDERAWFVYTKTNKQTLKSTRGCSEYPYGKISGSIGRCDVEILMYKAKEEGNCFYISFPVSMHLALQEQDSGTWRTSMPDRYVARIQSVRECGAKILNGADPKGSSFRALLSKYIRELKDNDEPGTYLSGQPLPPEHNSEVSESPLAEWATYVNSESQYATEAVIETVLHYLGFVGVLLITCIPMDKFYYDPKMQLAPKQSGPFNIGIPLVFRDNGGYASDGGSYGSGNHYEPAKLEGVLHWDHAADGTDQLGGWTTSVVSSDKDESGENEGSSGGGRRGRRRGGGGGGGADANAADAKRPRFANLHNYRRVFSSNFFPS
jgi:hypothetical protein